MQVNMRKESRRKTRTIFSVCWQAADGHMQSAEVQGVNLSGSGASFRSAEELPPGTSVFMESPDRHPSGYATVRYCTPSEIGYVVGVEFEEETRATMHATPEDATDYYEFLQISPKAEPATIHRVYRFMASRFHPDNPETGDPEKFLLLKRAYEVLSDPDSRLEYDLRREKREAPPPSPIFGSVDFVNGIEGEANRRLGVLSLLYKRRRSNSENPSISLIELEKAMGFPREYLDFTTWYLKSKEYIRVADNSDFTLTAEGVDYVESNSSKIPILKKLLNSGPRTTTSPATSAEDSAPVTRPQQLPPGEIEPWEPEEEDSAIHRKG